LRFPTVQACELTVAWMAVLVKASRGYRGKRRCLPFFTPRSQNRASRGFRLERKPIVGCSVLLRLFAPATRLLSRQTKQFVISDL
jgi:hypothetical protein